jgi:hypothetical protein
MGTYELGDGDISFLVDRLEQWPHDEGCKAMIKILEEQRPIPVPTKIGAVVATDAPAVGRVVYIRWAHDNQTTSPWIAANDHEQPYRTMDIGKIVQVMSEGVDI